MKNIVLLSLFLLLAACQVALDGDIREAPGGIRVTNNNPGPWRHVRMVLDDEYVLELDSLEAGADTLISLEDFRNGIGQTYAERRTRPQVLVINTAQGMMQKRW